jgi:hypothetical protein
MTRIPPSIDLHLRDIAEKAVGPNPWPLLDGTGWTREEFVSAVHARLRSKWRDQEAA